MFSISASRWCGSKHLYFKSSNSTMYLNENVLWLVTRDITNLLRTKVSLYKIWCFHGGITVLSSWSWHDAVWHVTKFRRNVRTLVCPSKRGATNSSCTWWEETQGYPQTGKLVSETKTWTRNLANTKYPADHNFPSYVCTYAGRWLCQQVSRQAGRERIMSISI
jgi:hypothetical protein